ncbi:MAG TPA: hypothetical protein VF468_21070, partial [Actinomycetota bacterium]|nr:hypothetical protein [Actinomycetota bacterium]
MTGEDGGGRWFGDGVPGALRAAAGCLEASARERTGPYGGASPRELAGLVAGVEPFPEVGA